MRFTDRQTDGQTDRQRDRMLIARPRLYSMQRGINRLRATMLDDWLSSLLCLAAEKDILLSLDLNARC